MCCNYYFEISHFTCILLVLTSLFYSIGGIVYEFVLRKKYTTTTTLKQMNAHFSSWPPLPEEVDYHHVKLPKLLKLLMNSLLSKSFPIAERVERLAISFGKDIRDNTHMASMKILQFSIPPNPLVQLRPKFFHPLDLGHPISSNLALSK